MKNQKVYKIERRVIRTGSVSTQEGTLAELVKAYKYRLEVGESWQHEKGNYKINTNPKSVATLVKNLNRAVDNAAANGYAGIIYTLVEE